MSTDGPISYAVQAALVDAAGKAFWYWDPYAHYLRKSGVHPALVARLCDRTRSKYEVMRELLEQLDKAGASGRQVQTQLIRGLLAMPVSDADGVDIGAARAAVARLRVAAREAGLLAAPRAVVDKAAAERRRETARAQREAERRAAQRRRALFDEYCALTAHVEDKQGRGYRLEEIIGEIAALDGIGYRPPFRKGTVTQTDGMLDFRGFQYLVEARWRGDAADVAAIGALAQNVSRSLQSTRGLFLSVPGFRPEVVREIEAGTKSVLLMTGQDLLLVLEGRYGLGEAMQLKVEEAAKRGHVLFDLARGAAA